MPNTYRNVYEIQKQGGVILARKPAAPPPEIVPMLKTVEQMSRISGIGENKLRELMDNGQLEYVQNGNRRLIADIAIWEWYNRVKMIAQPPCVKGG